MARLRAATDSDSAGVIALIADVFAEYPGCVLDVDAEEPELRAPASGFSRCWVVEDGRGTVAACVALALHGATAELKKLYVRRDLRRCGWGGRLVETVERAAREAGANRIELWSDTRFIAAHALYAACGYRATGRTRELHDLSRTTEYHFEKPLWG